MKLKHKELGSDKNYLAYFPVYFYTEVERKRKVFKGTQ